jgi:hypothetical protein
LLANVNSTTVAGRELEHMSSASKSNLVATLDKSLDINVNKVSFYVILRLPRRERDGVRRRLGMAQDGTPCAIVMGRSAAVRDGKT